MSYKSTSFYPLFILKDPTQKFYFTDTRIAEKTDQIEKIKNDNKYFDIILQIKLNALKLDERLNIEDLEDRILKLEKSIELLNDQLDRIYLD